MRVLFKRRRALYSALPDARRFFAALDTVQRAIRARRALTLTLFLTRTLTLTLTLPLTETVVVSM